MNFYKGLAVSASVLLFGVAALAQDSRPRVVTTGSSRPIHTTEVPRTPAVTTQTSSRPVRPPLLNDIPTPESPKPLVKKTVSSAPMNAVAALSSSRLVYERGMSSMIMDGINARLGIPYLYGSTGPNRYDCSGFVWSVFRDAGIDFIRASAKSLWQASVPVEGDERYKFGTLVFMNNLGHMGIVADENGFYHASSSKGITYSPFKGYWEKRINGFRRLPTAIRTTGDTDVD